jgi:hypothetical protein
VVHDRDYDPSTARLPKAPLGPDGEPLKGEPNHQAGYVPPPPAAWELRPSCLHYDRHHGENGTSDEE